MAHTRICKVLDHFLFHLTPESTGEKERACDNGNSLIAKKYCILNANRASLTWYLHQLMNNLNNVHCAVCTSAVLCTKCTTIDGAQISMPLTIPIFYKFDNFAIPIVAASQRFSRIHHVNRNKYFQLNLFFSCARVCVCGIACFFSNSAKVLVVISTRIVSQSLFHFHSAWLVNRSFCRCHCFCAQSIIAIL